MSLRATTYVCADSPVARSNLPGGILSEVRNPLQNLSTSLSHLEAGGDPEDVRSSQYLEDGAAEFQVQGLELDWTIVNWDGDLRVSGNRWGYHDFRGKKWQSVHKQEHWNYLKNAYRVLLTRARKGMVLFGPPGDSADHTRPPSFYDSTYRYVRRLGVASIE